MPIHHVAIWKEQKKRPAVVKYVANGVLFKVDEPTQWCSNVLCHESHSKFCICICIDSSQAINKAMEQMIWQIPTLTEQVREYKILLNH